jgi:hypothetical protein
MMMRTHALARGRRRRGPAAPQSDRQAGRVFSPNKTRKWEEDGRAIPTARGGGERRRAARPVSHLPSAACLLLLRTNRTPRRRRPPRLLLCHAVASICVRFSLSISFSLAGSGSSCSFRRSIVGGLVVGRAREDDTTGSRAGGPRGKARHGTARHGATVVVASPREPTLGSHNPHRMNERRAHWFLPPSVGAGSRGS